MFGLEKTLRSLTRSPFDSILAAAHRMARPLHFEEGGAVPHEGRVVEQPIDQDFVLPPDVREEEVLSEIQDRLRAKRFSMPKRSNSVIPRRHQPARELVVGQTNPPSPTRVKMKWGVTRVPTFLGRARLHRTCPGCHPHECRGSCAAVSTRSACAVSSRQVRK